MAVNFSTWLLFFSLFLSCNDYSRLASNQRNMVAVFLSYFGIAYFSANSKHNVHVRPCLHGLCIPTKSLPAAVLPHL